LEEHDITLNQLKERNNELTTTLTQLAETQEELSKVTSEKETILQQMKDTFNKLSETQGILSSLFIFLFQTNAIIIS
jgi:predicted  nucleic acid-binding Zn-ribbon protein